MPGDRPSGPRGVWRGPWPQGPALPDVPPLGERDLWAARELLGIPDPDAEPPVPGAPARPEGEGHAGAGPATAPRAPGRADPVEVGRAAVHGPEALGSAEAILGDGQARALLGRLWGRRCPTLSLLARAAVADPVPGAADHDESVARAVAARHLVEECHAMRCPRCASVLAHLDASPELSAGLAALPAQLWTVVVPRGDQAATGAGWWFARDARRVQVLGRPEGAGREVVLVDPWGAPCVQVLALGDGESADAGGAAEVHLHPGLGGGVPPRRWAL